MPTLQRPGATVNYEVWGEGAAAPWILLVNGHTRPLNDFRMMAKYLAEQGLRVAALDNRGAGKTETTRDFTLAEMAGDVTALLDELGAARAHLLGISMGGFIAQTVALAAPARVDHLVLVSTAASQRMIRLDERPWTRDLKEVEAKMLPYFTAEFARRNEVLVKSMVKQIAKNVEEGDFAERSQQQRRAAAGFDSRARLRQVAAPALVIHGAEDQIIPIEAGEELANGIRGARLEVLEDAGHLLLAERPKELYALVAGFVG
jgi:pimeloyl-ACP methyl ester carboxylesterase